MSTFPLTIEGVVDVDVVKGAACARDVPDLVIEIPHGATRAAHFTALRRQLKGAFPDDLIDFFFVNTDVGAPEAGVAVARAFTAARPSSSVAILRCQIPRTFIDCNRIIDPEAAPTTSARGEKITPGVVSYVKDPDDLQLLLSRYLAYRDVVGLAFSAVCGAGGAALMLHTYAPRSVDVEVDDDIVKALHAAYARDVVDTWPLRPAVDLITTTPDGVVLADPALVDGVKAGFEAVGVDVVENGTYPLHPSTGAYAFAERWPRQTLCLELRRDLLVQEFTPFQEMVVDDEKAARLGGALAAALVAWRDARACSGGQVD
jgi:hypothetical protein